MNFPDGTGISIPVGREKCVDFLCGQFPDQKDNIVRYFDTVYKFVEEAGAFAAKSANSTGEPGELKKFIMKKGFPKLYPTLAEYGLRSSHEVLSAFFPDCVKLQLALNVYWCFMGMNPERFPWSILAKCTVIYMEDKPYYLRGTSMMMNQAILEAARRMGCVAQMNCGVKKILVEDGRAVGVMDEFGREYRAKKIISNISPITTYGALMDPQDVPEAAREYLKPYTVGISAITCFIGLDCTPEEIGFTTSFTLNYESLDAIRDCQDAYKLLPENDPLVATCYTVDDRQVSPEGTSVITAGTLKYGEAWEKLPPEQYYEMKYEAGRRIVARLEKLYPGFTSHIEEMEIATPLTHMRYLHHPHGAIYGYEQDLRQAVFFFPNESKLEGLEFASGWVNACGFGPNYTYADGVALKVAEEV